LSIFYRVRQFAQAVTARNRPVDRALLSKYLSSAEVELFLRQSAALQQHGLRVLRVLEPRWGDDSVLMKAALLHDVGKTGGRIRLWHRIANVLLDAVSHRLRERVAAGEAGSWRYPFYVQIMHPALGAEMIRQLGSSSSLVKLVADHHTPVAETARQGLDRVRLAELQRADGFS